MRQSYWFKSGSRSASIISIILNKYWHISSRAAILEGDFQDYRAILQAGIKIGG